MVQFHLRDAATAREELRRVLASQHTAGMGMIPAGALMFNCAGRGKTFYGSAHHDLRAVHTFSGRLPVGGFFCGGEIGPVAGRNFLHGFTASIGFFRPLRAAAPASSGATSSESNTST